MDLQWAWRLSAGWDLTGEALEPYDFVDEDPEGEAEREERFRLVDSCPRELGPPRGSIWLSRAREQRAAQQLQGRAHFGSRGRSRPPPPPPPPPSSGGRGRSSRIDTLPKTDLAQVPVDLMVPVQQVLQNRGIPGQPR